MSLPKTTRSRLKTWLKRGARVAYALVTAGLLLEILLRVLFPVLRPKLQGAIENVQVVPWGSDRLAPVPPFIPDMDYQNILPPGLKNRLLYFSGGSFRITTISLWDGRVGLRSDPPQWPVDITVVGDSFSMCYTRFSDCWVKRLNSDHGWSVINLGQRGTGSRAHLQMLTTFGRPLQPHVVVWQWYGNDFNEDYGFALMQGEVQTLDAPLAYKTKADFGWPARYSAVYALVRDIVWTAQNDPPSSWTIYNRYAFDLSRPSNQYGREQSIKTLEEAQQIVEQEMGGKLVILLIPTKEEVQPELVEAASDPAYVAMLSEGRQQMLVLCQERDWSCIDATDTLLKQAQAGKDVYYAADPHINPLGNRLVADLVDEFLRTALEIQP